jgi:hypothetical protein
MQYRARVPAEPDGHDHAPGSVARGDPHEAELAAIALLCLMFAWPIDEPRDQHRRSPR